MATIHVNEKIYQGSQVIINNGKVTKLVIDGVEIKPEDTKEINIRIEGNLDKLKVDYCNKIDVVGNVAELSTMSGDVTITGDVTNGVNTQSGDVETNNINGNVETMSGDVKAETISGKVKTMSGDIKFKK